MSQKQEDIENQEEEAKTARHEDENTKNIEEPEQEEFIDWYDRYVRMSADFENFRKRVQKEKVETLKFGHEPLVLDLIPVIDNFERAVEHAKQAKDIEAIQTGIQMIFNQLLVNLERNGIVAKSCKGQEFDPNKHEAVSHVPSAEVANNFIIDEMQKSYFLHDKLLRPALVSVSKGDVEEETPAQEEIN